MRGDGWWRLTPLSSDAELEEVRGRRHPHPRPRARVLPGRLRAGHRRPARVGDGGRPRRAARRGARIGRPHASRSSPTPASRWSRRPTSPACPAAGLVTVTRGRLLHGFAIDSCGLTVVTETDIVGQRSSTKDMRRLPSRRRRAIDPLSLKPGDYVVHEQHGVGRYVDMVQRAVAGAEREYLVLEYAASKRGQPADRLFVPTDQLDLVTKYVGGEAPAGPPARRGGLAEGQGPRPQGGQADRRRAHPAVRSAPGEQGLRLRRRHPVAARARGRLPVRRDARPAGLHRRGQGRHGAARSRWTGSSAVTSGTARPRSPCVRRSRRCRTASRWPFSCRRRCWCSSTCRRSPSATRPSR